MLDGRTAIISGGATGIGLAIARLLGRLGSRIIICGKTPDKLETAANSLRDEGVETHHYPVNIRNEDDIADLFAQIDAWGWQPDILVNNAGGQFAAPALGISANGFRAVVDLNLTGSWLMSVAFARQFAAARKIHGKAQGSIVSIVLAQDHGIPGMVHAAAARAGVANMMKTLAFEWGPLGLTANAIAPGTVDTAALARYDRSTLEESSRRLPVPRMAHPDEIAHAVAYLVSPAARFITGVTLQIDGGEHLVGAQPQESATG